MGVGWLQRLPAASDRLDVALSLGCGLVAGLTYGLTQVRELLPYDGGEFQFLAVNGGHAHVTGYAVCLTLMQAFASLPFGEPILRATLFAAIMGGVAVALAYLIGRAASGWRAIGIALALAWGGAATVWSQAVQAEVYAIASVFTAAILWAVVRWLQDGKAWRLALAGALGGASLGVHGSVGLFAPGIGLALLAATIDRRSLLAALGGVGLGIVLFLAAFWHVDRSPRPSDAFSNVYLPWSAAFGTSAAELGSPAARLKFLLQAKQWQKSMFAAPEQSVARNALRYLRSLTHDFTWLWIAAILFGLGLAVWRSRPLATLLGVGLLFHHFYTFHYEIPDLYVFFIPAYLYLGLAAAFGLGAIFDYIHTHGSRRYLYGAVALLSAAAAGAQPGLKLSAIRTREATALIRDLPPHAELARQSREIEQLVLQLPPGALAAVNFSSLYRFVYLAHHHRRTDLRFVEARPWGIEQIDLPTYRARLAELAGNGPIVLGMPEAELKSLGYRGEKIGRVAGEYFWRVR